MHTFLLIVYLYLYFHCLRLLSALLRSLSSTLCNLSPNHNTGPENQKAVSQDVIFDTNGHLSYNFKLFQMQMAVRQNALSRCSWTKN
jgi:hypothetical protein